MKKLGLLTLAIMICGSMFAEGYQVNLLSAKQSGMGHVGVAMKLGAESMHFNPAGMAFMDGVADFSAGVSGILSKATYRNDGYKAKTDNDVSTPLYVYAGFRIYDNLKIGFSFTTPYGNSLRWPINWKGAELVEEISLKAFQLQPTVSWRIKDNISVGAGLMLDFGNFSLQRALAAPGALATILGPSYDNVVPVWARLTGKSALRAGYNIGVMWDINDQWSVGVSFRSKVTMRVKEGEAHVDYASELAKATLEQLAAQGVVAQIPPLDEGNFKAQLPLPANLTLGAQYKPIPRLTCALDLQLVGWSAYDVLTVKFTENVLNGYSIVAPKNYRNSFALRVGAQYQLTHRFDVRGGMYFDQTPVRKNFYNPETPGMNKLGFSVGTSFTPFHGFSIDFSALYIAGLGRRGSYDFDKPGSDLKNTFSGKYTAQAFAPTIGLSYNF